MNRNVEKLLVRAAALRDIIATELGHGAIGVKWAGLIDSIVEQAEAIAAEDAAAELTPSEGEPWVLRVNGPEVRFSEAQPAWKQVYDDGLSCEDRARWRSMFDDIAGREAK